MCIGCWEKAGSPNVTNDSVREAARLLGEALSCVSTNAHLVIDDLNFDDRFIDEALAGAEQGRARDEVTEEQYEIERSCLRALRVLSMDERWSAYAISENIIGPGA